MSPTSAYEVLAKAVATALGDVPPASRVLVALSGGPDSTALVHLLARCRPELFLHVAHLDHGLRVDSASESTFVAQLAERLGLVAHVERVDVRELSRHRGHGLEEAGQHARYEFLERTAAAIGAATVVLGHTLDDRAETLLLRLVRGAGTTGLSGMRARRGSLFRRPLLTVRRQQLHAWLAAQEEVWLSDPSNLDERIPRNFVRLRILPLLAELNPRVVEALARTAAILEAEDGYLAERAAEVEGPLEATTLASLPPALARRVAWAALRAATGTDRGLSHRHIDGLLGLAGSDRSPLATDLPGGKRARRVLGTIRIATVDVGRAEARQRRLEVPGVTIVSERLALRTTLVSGANRDGEVEFPACGDAVMIARSALGEQPLIRTPLPGDQFAPLGAPGRRRLGRYLRERGIAHADRAQISLVTGATGILWVVGHQVAEGARVGPSEDACVIEAITPPVTVGAR